MNKYVYTKKSTGVHMFDIQKQYEKIKLAARIIASIPDPSTITVNKYLKNKKIFLKFMKK